MRTHKRLAGKSAHVRLASKICSPTRVDTSRDCAMLLRQVGALLSRGQEQLRTRQVANNLTRNLNMLGMYRRWLDMYLSKTLLVRC